MPSPTNKGVKKKTVRAWAIITKGRLQHVIGIGGKKPPKMFYVDSWGPYESCREDVVEVKITYNPNQRI